MNIQWIKKILIKVQCLKKPPTFPECLSSISQQIKQEKPLIKYQNKKALVLLQCT